MLPAQEVKDFSADQIQRILEKAKKRTFTERNSPPIMTNLNDIPLQPPIKKIKASVVSTVDFGISNVFGSDTFSNNTFSNNTFFEQNADYDSIMRDTFIDNFLKEEVSLIFILLRMTLEQTKY